MEYIPLECIPLEFFAQQKFQWNSPNALLQVCNQVVYTGVLLHFEDEWTLAEEYCAECNVNWMYSVLMLLGSTLLYIHWRESHNSTYQFGLRGVDCYTVCIHHKKTRQK